MNTKLTIRIGIAVVVVGLLAVTVWKGLSRNSGPVVAQSPGPSVSASPVAVVYGNAPTDWQSYSSSSLAFRVRYPKNWKSGPCGPGCAAFGPTASSSPFLVGVNVTKKKLSDILSQAAPYQLSNNQVTVGTITWTKLVLQQPQTGDLFVSHFVEHNGSVYEFGLGIQDEAAAVIYGQMIQSFSFTK